MKKFKTTAMLASMLISCGMAGMVGCGLLAVKPGIHFWPYVAITLPVNVALNVVVMSIWPSLAWRQPPRKTHQL
jgi:hypothetical protein